MRQFLRTSLTVSRTFSYLQQNNSNVKKMRLILAFIVLFTFVVNINCKPVNPPIFGSIVNNPNGGNDFRITYGKEFGNFGASVFGAANLNGGPPNFGGSIDYNK